MKTYLLCFAALTLAACSSTPESSKLIIDKETYPMTRNEVILAIHDCEGNGLRAVVTTSRRKINNYTSDVVVDVTCAPRFKGYF